MVDKETARPHSGLIISFTMINGSLVVVHGAIFFSFSLNCFKPITIIMPYGIGGNALDMKDSVPL